MTAFKVLPGLKVVPSDRLIRACGDTAINTRLVHIFPCSDGETKTFPCALSDGHTGTGL